MYYEIISQGCPQGYAYVRDYMGNRIFYGSMEECIKCIDALMEVRLSHD